MNIIGIIPARLASSRFPDKPLKNICGMPMIGHVFFRSMMCKQLNSIYVATCDNKIADYTKSIGGKAVMTASTHERASDRAAEAMTIIEKETSKKIDIVVMIQGDEPLVTPRMIEASLRPLIEDPSINITNLMGPINSEEEHNDPNAVKVVIDKKNMALYFSREPIPSRKKARSFPKAYKQIAIIPFRRDFLLKFNALEPAPLEIVESVDMLRLLEHGYDVKMVESPDNTYGMDTPQDLVRIEAIMKNDPLLKKYIRAKV